MPGCVAVEGCGIAAYSCAKLLRTHGFRVSLNPVPKAGGPVLLINTSTQRLLADVFGSDSNLFADLPLIKKRIVRWNGDSEPKIFPHDGVIIGEGQLLDRLRPHVEAASDSFGSTAAGWTIFSTRKAIPATVQNFGSRRGTAVPVQRRHNSEDDACWIEALNDGWLFLLPAGRGLGSLLAVGAPPEELLEQSRLIGDQIDRIDACSAQLAAYPSIIDPLCGSGWLACGSGAMSFDPICGEGTGNSVREAILAAAVVRFVSSGSDATDGFTHYSSRLLSGFFRHLQLSLQFYSSSQPGDWWKAEHAELVRGLEWTRSQLLALPQSHCRLVGFDLHSR